MSFNPECRSRKGCCAECLRLAVEVFGSDWEEWQKASKRQRSRMYRQANAEKMNVQTQTWRQVNAEKVKQYNREYRQANVEKIRQLKRVYRQANAERIQQYNQTYQPAYRQANAQEIRQYQLVYRQVNTEKTKQYKQAYYQANVYEVRQRVKAYSQANPGKMQEVRTRYRARKRAAPINDLTSTQWKAIQAHYAHRCVYCNKRRKGKLTQDHITPLSKGGAHTASNIVPACGSCNSKKGTRGPLKPVQPLLLVMKG